MTQPDLDTAPAWMTVATASTIAAVSQRTIRRWAEAEMLRSSQPGGPNGRVLICRDSLRELIESSARGPVPRRSDAAISSIPDAR